jgi:hypothetical protein
VAALTWQLGRQAPPGVTVNAMSPIAATRMMASALERARKAGRSGGGGISFLSVADPEDLGPIGAHLVDSGFGWCSGQVLFVGGPEVAVVDAPRLIEVVRTDPVDSLTRVLDVVVPGAFAEAEARQASTGGGNPRFGPIFDEPAEPVSPSASVRSCAIVSDRPHLIEAVTRALGSRSIRCHRVEPVRGFGAAAAALTRLVASSGPIDAVVVAAAGRPSGTPCDGWERVLADHRDIVGQLHHDAGWARATADYAADAGRPVRLVTLTDATTSGGRSRAQAAAQHARVAAGATDGRVTAFAVGLEATEEGTGPTSGGLVDHLLTHPEAGALAGAELVVGDGWLGLRSHPRPIGSVTYGGPGLPDWLDGTLRELIHDSGDPSGGSPA